MKAMILAAGFGTRLKPLTDFTPKPLLPILNRPQIEYILEFLRASGVREAIINLHHLPDAIRSHLGTRYRKALNITYSLEKEILGTGGGLKNVESFFDDEPFILINGDAIVEVDIGKALDLHLSSRAAATMVVRKWEEGYGLVEMDGDGRIRRILERGGGEGLTPVVFTGVHILTKRIFDYLPGGRFSCINRDGYGAMLEAGEIIRGFTAKGYWRDCGTLTGYFGANMDFLKGEIPRHCAGLIGSPASLRSDSFPGVEFTHPVAVGPRCRIEKASSIGPLAVLGEGCTVGRGCRIAQTVALPGASFHDGEKVSGCIRSERNSIGVGGPLHDRRGGRC